MLDAEYLEQMRAHVDEGGKLTHINAVELMAELDRLREGLKSAHGHLASAVVQTISSDDRIIADHVLSAYDTVRDTLFPKK